VLGATTGAVEGVLAGTLEGAVAGMVPGAVAGELAGASEGVLAGTTKSGGIPMSVGVAAVGTTAAVGVIVVGATGCEITEHTKRVNKAKYLNILVVIKLIFNKN
jgi:hypothetical protein